MQQLPLWSVDLVEQLAEEFPERSLDRTDIDKSERQIWYEAGQRSVVRYLLQLKKELDDDNILTRKE